MQITSKFTIGIHILTCIDFFHGKVPVNSSLLSQSIGANPVIVRGVMSSLSKAGMISTGKGKKDIVLQKPLSQVTLYDVYRAVDDMSEKGIFRFHENVSPVCPVGKNIHKALDGKLLRVQGVMEQEMRQIPVSTVTEDIRKEIRLTG